MFTTAIDLDFNHPLTWNNFAETDSKVVSTVLYAYSLETFLVYSFNTALREHDSTKLLTYGPLSMCLFNIMSLRDEFRAKDAETIGKDHISVYRGLKL